MGSLFSKSESERITNCNKSFFELKSKDIDGK